jgi:SAM-dependent methyltransferase
METAQERGDEQAILWNGCAGQAWVDAQELLDQMLAPFEQLLVETIPAESNACVLDVGCGTGSTTLAVARKLGARGTCEGIDISAPMIAAAQARAAHAGTTVRFVRANAENHAFAPERFDHIISRFGVMFFEDSVRAFKNLRGAAQPGAVLQFVAFRSAAENPFMTTAERAAAPLLPNLPARRADGPGQFAFADARNVHDILEQSGWTGIEIRPVDVPCSLPEPALLSYLTQLGPLGLILPSLNARLREQIIQTVRAAFDPYVHGPEVRFAAACWSVRARA